MTSRTWEKLVRDRIPEILAGQGIESTVRTLGEAEYLTALKEKLLEEAAEAQREQDPRDIALELTDVVEVAYALAATIGISRDRLEVLRQERATERGGFEARVFLEYTDN
ncbi:MAG TPA: nucleoside triphosphate pyrophosphohydrolase [Chloroflexota bacterium]|nr:nucleoside triphosphate pyrophosphohydrolase [Chloroflexota bacterium]